ncbi:MAG: heme ABC exporter ATP-binding protein CcmA [Acidobacteriota bacterium]|nr:heme ABC exporter ATP-binding protein CcmA [Acidobacteriota bacterium]MDH3783813.1 heme ABC exporter ATP-binding protein CcmA [Acidobacteriota bacterium]
MIEVRSLQKSFGSIHAVQDLSFTVNAGEIYGLLGPNGAGKTTTLSMLAGLLEPDDGTVRFADLDLTRDRDAVQRQLGVVPQEVALYEEFSARENLRFWGGLYGLAGNTLQESVERVLRQVGLSDNADRPVRGFSGGMKRRLNLSLGLVHEPKIVMLDEPTVGIDPQARHNILEVVRQIAEQGTTILYTTHYLEEAETLCDRIGILDEGRLLADGTLEELKREAGEGEWITVSGDDVETRLRNLVGEDRSVRWVSGERNRVVLTAIGEGQAIPLLQRLLRETEGIDGVTIQPPSLNGLFLKLTGRELRD